SYDGDTATRLLDLLASRLAEAVSADIQRLGQLSVAQNLDAHVPALDQAAAPQGGLVDGRAAVEAVELSNVDGDGVHRERHPEATFRQAALDWRLTTLEVELAYVATLPRFLSLEAAPRHLALARTWTAALAPLLL